MLPIITLDDLYKKGVCHHYRQKFFDTFGYSTIVCEEVIAKASKFIVWDNAARYLLSEKSALRYFELIRPSRHDADQMWRDHRHFYNEKARRFSLAKLVPGFQSRIEKLCDDDDDRTRKWLNQRKGEIFVQLYIKDHTPKPKTKSKKS